ncbi:hypothetical protein NLA06_03095 [Desulfomicrobium sp. ZS1]|uniref:hypothetical protein n=1 Tax=Desulfomicrobium sp. ZS1 TaxID=2952228 RepID=UPI0020B3A08A|nr:hypothetical protein [Desulfomicrobium sp. ZS1]UTF50896.1 hypothetical protein NLA06_03095 [Desulfomicrobium sp. ZS1]
MKPALRKMRDRLESVAMDREPWKPPLLIFDETRVGGKIHLSKKDADGNPEGGFFDTRQELLDRYFDPAVHGFVVCVEVYDCTKEPIPTREDYR